MSMLLEYVFQIALCLAGIVAGFVITRYYYFKANPEQTFQRAFALAVRSGRKPPAAPETPLQCSDRGLVLRWAMDLIVRYERNELYSGELMVAARSMGEAGALILEAFGAAEEAASGPDGPMRLTPPYFRLRDAAFQAKLSEARARIEAELAAWE